MAAERSHVFADLLRTARRAAGLTQEELAERAGISVRALRKLESGAIQTPRRDTVALLTAALGLREPEQAAFAQAARRPRHRPSPQLGKLVASAPERPLVGRAPELTRLASHLAGEGPPLLLLAGEPGIGKTRLLQEAAARAHEAGWTVLAGGCTRRSGQEPYAPLLAALARFLAGQPAARLRADLEGCSWLVRLLPELAERAVVPAPSWTLPPEQERRLMFTAVDRLLANIAGPAGTLLVLDDLQWAGSDALDLLAALLHTQAGPLRVIGAHRSTEVGADHPLAVMRADLAREDQVEEQALGPLAPAEARALVDGLLPATPEASVLAAWVVERAGGVPFFLVSCARGVADAEAEDGGAAAHLPWTVRQSVLQRVAALPEAVRTLLGLAAVVGRELSRTMLLAAAAGALGAERAPLLGAIEAACAAGLLTEDERGDYRFVHDLIREAVLADLGAARRAAWHLAWAEALERPEGERAGRAAELAWHFVRADEPARALPYALAAGDRADAAYAHAEAERVYAMAAELARAVGDAGSEARALKKLGGVRYTLGRHTQALPAYERAAHLYREAGDWDQYAWDTIASIRCWLDRGDQELAAERLRALLRVLATQEERQQWDTDGDPLRADAAPDLSRLAARTAAHVCDMIAQCSLSLGRLPDALSAADRALAFARAAGDAVREAAAQVRRGLVLWDGRALDGEERLDEALAAFIEAGQLAQAAGDLHLLFKAHTNSADIQSLRGAIEEAIQLYASMLPVAEQWGAPAELAYVHTGFGATLVVAGRWVEARMHFEAVQVLAATVPPSYQTAYGAIHYAWLSHLQGRPEAPGLIDQALALAAQFNHIADLPLYLVQALAETDLLAGRDEAARIRVESLLAADGALFMYGSHAVKAALIPMQAWAAAERGDMRQADLLVRGEIERARRVGYRPALADALRIRALLAVRQGRSQEAEAALEESLSLCRAMPYPYAEAKALYVYGQLYAARDEPERARERFAQALAILNRLGERLYAEQIERALAESLPDKRPLP
jgi:tetratricopeptide (TPR) repeat protein/transcriptional regulator with XRE-family HTH domain